jgi:hypothetical protein
VGATVGATSGGYSAPFAASGSTLSQNVQTVDLSGGRADYLFYVATAGEYAMVAVVNAPTDGNNSFFVNIDATPVVPDSIWDVYPLTSGFATRVCSWRGNGSDVAPQFSPMYFNLSSGLHDLQIYGREANTILQSVSLIKRPSSPSLVSVTSGN